MNRQYADRVRERCDKAMQGKDIKKEGSMFYASEAIRSMVGHFDVLFVDTLIQGVGEHMNATTPEDRAVLKYLIWCMCQENNTMGKGLLRYDKTHKAVVFKERVNGQA